MRIKIAITAFALVGVIALTNAEAANPTTSNTMQEKAAVTTTESKATVKDIDYKTRKVTLQSIDGDEFSFIAGDKIKNLDQIKKGDTVVANYTEAVVVEIGHQGKAKAPTSTTVTKSARPGSKPQGGITRQVTTSVIISAIDKKTPSVTFKNADGETETFKVIHPERLQGVKVGDKIDITYTEALALKVEKTSKQ